MAIVIPSASRSVTWVILRVPPEQNTIPGYEEFFDIIVSIIHPPAIVDLETIRIHLVGRNMIRSPVVVVKGGVTPKAKGQMRSGSGEAGEAGWLASCGTAARMYMIRASAWY